MNRKPPKALPWKPCPNCMKPIANYMGEKVDMSGDEHDPKGLSCPRSKKSIEHERLSKRLRELVDEAANRQ